MDWVLTLLIILGGLIFILATGLPVAFSFLVINLIGVYFLWGGTNGLFNLIYSVYSSVASFSLLPVLLFVLMGEVLFHSELAFKAVEVVDKWLGKVPGRLCLVTIGAGTLFSSLSGSSMGTTAMLGTTMLPEMRRRGYKYTLAIGSCMSGGLAMIIPPSAMAVVLASICQVSIGAILIGGIIPGLILASLYSFYIIGRCVLQPDIAPSYSFEDIPFREKLLFLAKDLLPMAFIIFIVIGLIFMGIATPTESSAMGALACFILALIYRKINWPMLKKTFSGTLKITVMMFTILTGSQAFSQILAYSGATAGLAKFTSGLPIHPIIVMMLMQFVILVLGTFMEPVSIMMISMPIFIPIIKSFGFSDIWFALITLINMEISMKTPPFGFLLFVMRGIVPYDVKMSDIYKATFPFVVIDIIGICILMMWPGVALWLPNIMTH